MTSAIVTAEELRVYYRATGRAQIRASWESQFPNSVTQGLEKTKSKAQRCLKREDL